MKSKEQLIMDALKEKGKKYYTLIKNLAESFIYEQDIADQEGGYYEVEIEIKRSVLVEATCVDDARKRAKEPRFWCYGRPFKKEEISPGTVVQKFAKGKNAKRPKRGGEDE